MKLFCNNDGNTLELGKFFEDVQNNGGCVEYVSDADNTVKGLILVTKTMKLAMLTSNPPAIQLDTSFGIDKAHYKLTSLCYLNPVTNKTEIGA